MMIAMMIVKNAKKRSVFINVYHYYKAGSQQTYSLVAPDREVKRFEINLKTMNVKPIGGDLNAVSRERSSNRISKSRQVG